MEDHDLKTPLHLGALALSLSLSAATAGADTAGVRFSQLDAPHHGKAMEVAVWFPADEQDTSGRTIVVAENPVFHGVDALENAAMAAGRHPVVVLSHGWGGSMRSLAWLSAGLAQRGAIVVGVNHPNSTWGDFDPAKGIKHWSRVHDLGVALDWVVSHRDFATQVDANRLMAVGFSYGGWTALSMGGMRGNHAQTIAACKRLGDALVFCDALLSDAHGLPSVAPAAWDADYKDARITHVAAIDPGLIWGLDADDAAALEPQVRLIGLGDGANRLPDTDFDASGLANLLPDARITRLVPAFHFTALPLCKPAGEEILRSEGDDPVCSDPSGANRAAVHQQIIDIIARDLGL